MKEGQENNRRILLYCIILGDWLANALNPDKPGAMVRNDCAKSKQRVRIIEMKYISI